MLNNAPYLSYEDVSLDQRIKAMEELLQSWEIHLSFILSKKKSALVPTIVQKITEWYKLVPSPSELGENARNHPFHHFYVLNIHGIPLYTKSWIKLKEGDSYMVSGLMSALMCFSENIIGSHLKTIQTEEGTFLLIERNREKELVFVVIAEYEKEYVRTILKHMSAQFQEQYKEEIQIWKGQNMFGNFSEYIDELIESIPW